MNPVAIGMDLFLAALLIAALVMGVRLNARLKALKQSHEGFAHAIVELNDAAVRAERGLASLREATTETHDSLLARIDTARSLSARLDGQIQAARNIMESNELSRPAVASAATALSNASPGLAGGHPPESVMKLAKRFGLSLDSEAAPLSPAAVRAAATTRPAPRPQHPTRRRNAFEDELFEPEGAPPRTGASVPEPVLDAPMELSDALDIPAPSVADDFAARIRARRSMR